VQEQTGPTLYGLSAGHWNQHFFFFFSETNGGKDQPKIHAGTGPESWMRFGRNVLDGRPAGTCVANVGGGEDVIAQSFLDWGGRPEFSMST